MVKKPTSPIMTTRGRNSREVGSGRLKRVLGVQSALEMGVPGGEGAAGLPPPKDPPKRRMAMGWSMSFCAAPRWAAGSMAGSTNGRLRSSRCGCHRCDRRRANGQSRWPADGDQGRGAGDCRLAPDWMPGAIPRCIPALVPGNQHGERGEVVVVGHERVRFGAEVAHHMADHRTARLPGQVRAPSTAD